jgi:hypothetical protein
VKNRVPSGLSICRRLVEMHGGIMLCIHRRQGSHFCLLPRTNADNPITDSYGVKHDSRRILIAEVTELSNMMREL